MLLTLILSLTVILFVWLMLYSAVALIQKKALFSSAPKDIQAAIRDREKERFKGARILGVILLSILKQSVVRGIGNSVLTGNRRLQKF